MEGPKGLITTIVGVLIGLTFLVALTSMSNPMTDLVTGNTTDGDVNFTEGDINLSIISTQPTASCSDIEIINATGGEEVIGEGNYTFYPTNCSYKVQTDSAYKDTLVNSSYDYSYEPSTYVDSSMARVLLRVLLGLFGLVIVGGIIVYVMRAFSSRD